MAELPSLAEFVRELRLRVSLYSAEFRSDRALVKSALVEPFLRLMGFDPESPADVRPQYSTPGGIVDYALFNEGDLLAFVLARELGAELDPKEGVRLCLMGRAGFLLLTDGDIWQAYRVKDGSLLMEWSLLNDPVEELFRRIDEFRRLLGLESGRYEEELRCYTRRGREVRVKVLNNMDGLLIRRLKQVGKLPYSHIAKMLLEGRVVFLSGGIDNKNITYIRKRIEREVGGEVECYPAIYGDSAGYSFVLKRPSQRSD